MIIRFRILIIVTEIQFSSRFDKKTYLLVANLSKYSILFDTTSYRNVFALNCHDFAKNYHLS